MTKEMMIFSNAGKILNLAKRIVILICLLIPYKSLYAQDFDVQYLGETSLLDLDTEIFVRSSELKECAVLIISSTKKLTFDADVDIIKCERFWNRPESVIYASPSTKILIIGYKSLTPLCYELPVSLETGRIYLFDVKTLKKSDSDGGSVPISMSSTDIKLSGFRQNPFVMTGSLEPVYDNSGKACAVIRYFVNDDNFVIEPNMGEMKTIKKLGQIIQYVPVGTRRLTIRNGSFMPLNGYELPLELEPMVAYDVNISLLDSAIKRQKASPDYETFLGIGYNGTMTFSANGNHHSFTIHCNNDWEISAPSWCKLSCTSGSGNMEVDVKARINFGTDTRSGVIVIRSGDVTATIKVEQK